MTREAVEEAVLSILAVRERSPVLPCADAGADADAGVADAVLVGGSGGRWMTCDRCRWPTWRSNALFSASNPSFSAVQAARSTVTCQEGAGQGRRG